MFMHHHHKAKQKILLPYLFPQQHSSANVTSTPGGARIPFHNGILKDLKFVNNTVKVKLFLCLTKHNAMKTYSGNGGIAPLILDLGTRWR
jgi:hypothetical protein